MRTKPTHIPVRNRDEFAKARTLIARQTDQRLLEEQIEQLNDEFELLYAQIRDGNEVVLHYPDGLQLTIRRVRPRKPKIDPAKT